MTIRIRIARSATDDLKDFAIEAVQGATLTGYGLLVAMLWIVMAGRLH
jgi:hypothetical protein